MVHSAMKLIDFGECLKDMLLRIQIDEAEQVSKACVFLGGLVFLDSWTCVLWLGEGGGSAGKGVHLVGDCLQDGEESVKIDFSLL